MLNGKLDQLAMTLLSKALEGGVQIVIFCFDPEAKIEPYPINYRVKWEGSEDPEVDPDDLWRGESERDCQRVPAPDMQQARTTLTWQMPNGAKQPRDGMPTDLLAKVIGSFLAVAGEEAEDVVEAVHSIGHEWFGSARIVYQGTPIQIQLRASPVSFGEIDLQTIFRDRGGSNFNVPACRTINLSVILPLVR